MEYLTKSIKRADSAVIKCVKQAHQWLIIAFCFEATYQELKTDFGNQRMMADFLTSLLISFVDKHGEHNSLLPLNFIQFLRCALK